MRERPLYLRAQVLWVLLVVLVIVRADIGRNREAGRDRQPQIGHFGQSSALAAQQIAHRRLALGAAVAKAINPLALAFGRARSRLRLGLRPRLGLGLEGLACQPFFALCSDARTFSFGHRSSNVYGTT